MSCRHGWYDCGHWYGPPPDWGWYGPADRDDVADTPFRRRYRRGHRVDRGPTPEDLESRLAELRDEMQRIEEELGELRGVGAKSP